MDVNALAAGEVLELRIKGKVLSSSTERLILLQTYVGTVSDPHTQSPPIPMPQGGTITLKQTSGTGRSYDWAVITLD